VTTISTDVVIVGGGPTGLVAGLCLARHGLRSVLVERHPTTAVHPQAHTLNFRSMELFRQWDLEDAVRAAAYPAQHAKKLLDLPMMMFGEMTEADQEFVDAYLARIAANERFVSPAVRASCAQDVIEQLLIDLVRTHESCDVRFATTCTQLHQDEDGVTAGMQPADGEAFTVRARYAIAADGSSSRARQALGIEMIGEPDLGTILGVYFHADLTATFGDPPPLLTATKDPEIPGGFIAMDGIRRFVFNTPVAADVNVERDYPIERCHDMVRRTTGSDDSVDIDIRSVRPWRMTAHVAERMRVKRIFLAGDAAHAFPPTGGFGMNSGIQDAHNLAWKLAAVCHGWGAESLLDSYEAERHPVAFFNTAQSLRNANRGPGSSREAAQFALIASRATNSVRSQLDDDLSESVRRFFSAREHFMAIGQDIGFAYDRRDAAVIHGDVEPTPMMTSEYVPNANPGARIAHLWLDLDGFRRSTVDVCDGAFVVFAATNLDTYRTAAAGYANQPSVRVIDLGAVGDVPWAEAFGIGLDGVVVVRPDGHVAYRSKTAVEHPERLLNEVIAAICELDPSAVP
jgi:putative polyketide hydroxylase